VSLSEIAARSSAARGRRGEGDRTRQAILLAASELLHELGSEEAVSIRAVAERVQLTAPTIYRYFTDKDHLLFEVCGLHFDQFEDEVILPTLADNDDPLDALLAIGRAYVRFGVDNPEHYRIMFMGHSDHTPEQWSDVQVLDTGAFGSMVQIVQRCIDAGHLRADLGGGDGVGPAVTIAWMLWAALHCVVALAVAKPLMPGPSLEARTEAMLDVLLRGVLA
jgi:AcrR family transcriptional regulator